MLVAGLYQLVNYTSDPSERAFNLEVAQRLSNRLEDSWRWDKWRFVLPEELVGN